MHGDVHASQTSENETHTIDENDKAATASARHRWQLAALLLVALLVPASLAADDWTSFAAAYGRSFARGDLVIAWLFYAKSLWLLALFTFIAALLIRAGWWKSGWLLFVAWLMVACVFMKADRETYGRMHLHLRDYAAFLRAPGAGRFAGELHPVRYLVTLSAQAAQDVVLLPLAVGIVIALLLRRFCSAQTGKRLTRSLAIALLLAAVGIVPAQRFYADRQTLVRAHASLPFDFRWSAPGDAFVDAGAFGKNFNTRLSHSADVLWQPRAATTQPIVALPSDARRDVVLIIVESLRADALVPDVMPRLSALADRGTRLERHVSGAKYTQFGLYNLLVGRPALTFGIDAESAAPMMAATTFRDLGYATQYLGTADYHWRGLEHVIDGGTFARVRSFPLEDWPVADHFALRAAHASLNATDAAPNFIVLYVASTHFPYKYPPRFATRLPDVFPHRNVPMMTEADDRPSLINRYRNACSFLDDEIATMIDGIDLSRTVVAITGDHGESFWDDHSLSHGGRWSDVVTRVPCVLLGAGVPAGVRDDRPTCHQDVMPTLLHLATGRPVPLEGCTGRDVFARGVDDDAVRLLCSESNEDRAKGLFERGDRRLLIEFPRMHRGATVLGTVDRQGSVDPYDAPPAGDAAAWADGVGRLLLPLDGDDDHCPGPGASR